MHVAEFPFPCYIIPSILWVVLNLCFKTDVYIIYYVSHVMNIPVPKHDFNFFYCNIVFIVKFFCKLVSVYKFLRDIFLEYSYSWVLEFLHVLCVQTLFTFLLQSIFSWSFSQKTSLENSVSFWNRKIWCPM
jgi:hypothetical protein